MDNKVVLERAITNDIMKWLKKNYAFSIKTHGGAFQVAGLPDILTIARNGRFVGLEVKRPDIGHLTALQAAMLRTINKCGGYAVVACSVADAQDAMRRAERGDIEEEATFV